MPNEPIIPRPPEFTPNIAGSPPLPLPSAVPEIRLAEAVILILIVRIANCTQRVVDMVHTAIHTATDHLPFKVKAIVCDTRTEISTLRADMIRP